jgi:hypothetical protein
MKFTERGEHMGEGMTELARWKMIEQDEPYCRMAPIRSVFDGLPPFDILKQEHQERVAKLKRKKGKSS